MFKKLLIFFSFSALVVLLWAAPPVKAQTEECEASLNVVVKDYSGDFIPGVRVRVYKQITDVNGLPKPGEQIGSNRVDEITGLAAIDLNLDGETVPIAIVVENPDILGLNFFFANQGTVGCGQQSDKNLTLSSFRVEVYDTEGSLQKNVDVRLYSQDTDASGTPYANERLGTFDTQERGYATFYLPAIGQTVSDKASNLYTLSIVSREGNEFFKYNMMTRSAQQEKVSFHLSGAVITAKDAQTGEPLPNLRLKVYERELDPLGGYIPGRQLESITTNEDGQAFFEADTGLYYIQYTKQSGEDINTLLEVKQGKKAYLDLWLRDYARSRCDIKSILHLSFRDYNKKILSGIRYYLFMQDLNYDGQPVQGQRVVSGQTDEHGLAVEEFRPQPAEKYLLKVCHNQDDAGCFWFHDIQFNCRDELTLEKFLNTTKIILRDMDRKLLPDRRFRIFMAKYNIDNQLIIDEDKELGRYRLPDEGAFYTYLSPSDSFDRQNRYAITVDGEEERLHDFFTVPSEGDLTLEYLIGPDKMIRYEQPTDRSVAGRLKGRILLQVEDNGEAWYVNPADEKRYYLGRPEDAFAIMKSLSVGITNADLGRLRPDLSLVEGVDNDNDGLANVAEESFGTDVNNPDTDGDGYNDYEELQNGFNARGSGRWNYDSGFAAAQSGRILLQVEGNGEAWYIYPVNNLRYYLSRPKDAYAIMRELGLGITNADLQKIPVGSL